jgi:hypothetical protein
MGSFAPDLRARGSLGRGSLDWVRLLPDRPCPFRRRNVEGAPPRRRSAGGIGFVRAGARRLDSSLTRDFPGAFEAFGNWLRSRGNAAGSRTGRPPGRCRDDVRSLLDRAGDLASIAPIGAPRRRFGVWRDWVRLRRFPSRRGRTGPRRIGFDRAAFPLQRAACQGAGRLRDGAASHLNVRRVPVVRSRTAARPGGRGGVRVGRIAHDFRGIRPAPLAPGGAEESISAVVRTGAALC